MRTQRNERGMVFKASPRRSHNLLQGHHPIVLPDKHVSTLQESQGDGELTFATQIYVVPGDAESVPTHEVAQARNSNGSIPDRRLMTKGLANGNPVRNLMAALERKHESAISSIHNQASACPPMDSALTSGSGSPQLSAGPDSGADKQDLHHTEESDKRADLGLHDSNAVPEANRFLRSPPARDRHRSQEQPLLPNPPISGFRDSQLNTSKRSASTYGNKHPVTSDPDVTQLLESSRSHTAIASDKPYTPWAGVKLRHVLTIVPKDQQEMLASPLSWFPPEPGCDPKSVHVPPAVFLEAVKEAQLKICSSSRNSDGMNIVDNVGLADHGDQFNEHAAAPGSLSETQLEEDRYSWSRSPSPTHVKQGDAHDEAEDSRSRTSSPSPTPMSTPAGNNDELPPDSSPEGSGSFATTATRLQLGLAPAVVYVDSDLDMRDNVDEGSANQTYPSRYTASSPPEAPTEKVRNVSDSPTSCVNGHTFDCLTRSTLFSVKDAKRISRDNTVIRFAPIVVGSETTEAKRISLDLSSDAPDEHKSEVKRSTVQTDDSSPIQSASQISLPPSNPFVVSLTPSIVTTNVSTGKVLRTGSSLPPNEELLQSRLTHDSSPSPDIGGFTYQVVDPTMFTPFANTKRASERTSISTLPHKRQKVDPKQFDSHQDSQSETESKTALQLMKKSSATLMHTSASGNSPETSWNHHSPSSSRRTGDGNARADQLRPDPPLYKPSKKHSIISNDSQSPLRAQRLQSYSRERSEPRIPASLMTVPQDPATPAEHARFCAAYPAYKGDVDHFENMCYRFNNFRKSGSISGMVLADGFVGCHFTEYLPIQRSGQNVRSYELWNLRSESKLEWNEAVISMSYLDRLSATHRARTMPPAPNAFDSLGGETPDHNRGNRQWWENADEAPFRIMQSQYLKLKSVTRNAAVATQVVRLQDDVLVQGPKLRLSGWNF